MQSEGATALRGGLQKGIYIPTQYVQKHAGKMFHLTKMSSICVWVWGVGVCACLGIACMSCPLCIRSTAYI